MVVAVVGLHEFRPPLSRDAGEVEAHGPHGVGPLGRDEVGKEEQHERRSGRRHAEIRLGHVRGVAVVVFRQEEKLKRDELLEGRDKALQVLRGVGGVPLDENLPSL